MGMCVLQEGVDAATGELLGPFATHTGRDWMRREGKRAKGVKGARTMNGVALILRGSPRREERHSGRMLDERRKHGSRGGA